MKNTKKLSFQHEFGVMLKTYTGDIDYVERLIRSYIIYNVENIQLYIVVPKSDITEFEQFAKGNIQLLCDEDITNEYLKSGHHDYIKEGRGIINAGVTKLAFWETSLCENYFAIDSDMVFIRPFYKRDFFNAEFTPYTIISTYPELLIDPFYYDRYWKKRENSYKNVKKIVGLSINLDKTTCCSQVMSSVVLADFKSNFLKTKEWSYVDAMICENYEFFWYAAWIQKTKIIDIVEKHDLVKIIHHQGEHIMLHDAGIRISDLSREYLGVIVNSNWSRQYGMVDFDEPPTNKYYEFGAWSAWSKKR